MQSTEPKKPALPRGVIRLLRSGALDEARTKRVLEVHDVTGVEPLLRANAPAGAASVSESGCD